MTALERTVLAHRYLYYVKACPIISDREYDALERSALAENPTSEALNCPGSDLETSYSDEVKEEARRLAG